MKLLDQTLQRIKPLDARAMAKAQAHLDELTKPPGSLGALEDIARRLAGIRGEVPRRLSRKAHILMAGDHGVVAEGVSAFPQEVTPQMVFNFSRGGAAINVLARHASAELVLVDIGVASDLPELPGLLKRKVAPGTANLARGPAMTREQAIAALEVGIEVASAKIEAGNELLGIGEMGIGNTTPSSAILAVFSGRPVEEITGRGTGVDANRLRLKIKAIQQGLAINKPNPDDPLDVLAKVGGLEIAGMAGVILAGAAMRVPVIIDGFISGAAALVATRLAPLAGEFILASHLSEEPGHAVALELLGLKPMLTMQMRLGEGTGAALGMTLVDAAIMIYHEMATFSQAGISGALKS
ncbi:nicotinate-nucleotide--dimethylbenzimidazole phosphoribosyltransferase [Neomoorella thermoacetica]|uniref:nicotinate-nucleotide--dimethylbenzimidazole phosphoribosyltransferase n=1 Tax=Neomoorella thermoacetica TaxID=1525 RepID=UPI0008FB98E7|nr:nicotinate-nucleotide--dimethylbenzimidazole phosphoribosyltransferase [Moorella thermoacetica]APC08241.1 nicotinate-nucleotide--dimethylbenzimidazole phosphoribosyltransferase [Moorella thermoacetica]